MSLDSSSSYVDRKIISVSQKRQITIPQKYFEQLGITSEVECFVKDGALIVRPLKVNQDDFSVEILRELVAKGLSGKELIAQFEKASADMRTAISMLHEEGRQIANGEKPSPSMEDIFGGED